MLFTHRAECEIDAVVQTLNRATGLVHRVPMLVLLEAFQASCRVQQLFVQMPYCCAMVYAESPRRGSYIGFFKDVSRTSGFDHEAFQQTHLLPGLFSITKCHLLL